MRSKELISSGTPTPSPARPGNIYRQYTDSDHGIRRGIRVDRMPRASAASTFLYLRAQIRLFESDDAKRRRRKSSLSRNIRHVEYPDECGNTLVMLRCPHVRRADFDGWPMWGILQLANTMPVARLKQIVFNG